MKKISILLLSAFLIFNASCMDKKNKCNYSGQLEYNYAIEIAKNYMRKVGYYKDDTTVFMYDPKSSLWHMRYSSNTEALKEYGLIGKSYHAISFVGDTAWTRDGGATVFVDMKDEKVIGVLYDSGQYVGNDIN